MTFEQAKSMYVHRFTMEHVPDWARGSFDGPCGDRELVGRYPAPQYRTDREWFENTKFPPDNPFAVSKRDKSCYSTNPSWPLGQSLEKPFRRE